MWRVDILYEPYGVQKATQQRKGRYPYELHKSILVLANVAFEDGEGCRLK